MSLIKYRTEINKALNPVFPWQPRSSFDEATITHEPYQRIEVDVCATEEEVELIKEAHREGHKQVLLITTNMDMVCWINDTDKYLVIVAEALL